MTMETQRIKVTTPHGKLSLEVVIVPETHGLLAVHRGLIGYRAISDLWVISHVPSGYPYQFGLPTRKRAIVIAQERYRDAQGNPDIRSRGWRKAMRALGLWK